MFWKKSSYLGVATGLSAGSRPKQQSPNFLWFSVFNLFVVVPYWFSLDFSWYVKGFIPPGCFDFRVMMMMMIIILYSLYGSNRFFYLFFRKSPIYQTPFRKTWNSKKYSSSPTHSNPFEYYYYIGTSWVPKRMEIDPKLCT